MNQGWKKGVCLPYAGNRMLFKIASLRRLLLVKIDGLAAAADLSGGPRGGNVIGEGMFGVPAGEDLLRCPLA
jgi:hypothetical protein